MPNNMKGLIPMVVLSMEQCVAILSVCFFILGVICACLATWFYKNYIAVEDDNIVDDSDYVVM